MGLLAEPQHLVCQLKAALGALAPDLAEGHIDPVLGALAPNQLQLCLGILRKPVDGHHSRQSKDLSDILHML